MAKRDNGILAPGLKDAFINAMYDKAANQIGVSRDELMDIIKSESAGDPNKIGGLDSFTMPDGTVMENPYVLTQDEWNLMRDYTEGKFYWSISEKRAAEAAYNKYQQYVQWYNDQQNTGFETDYNSAQSSAERIWEAGQNPNFVGLDGAGTVEAANNNTPAPAPVGGSDFLDVTSSCFQWLGTAIQIASGISGLMTADFQRTALALQNSGQRLRNASDTASLVDSLYDFMPNELFEDSGDELSTDSIVASVSSVLPNLGLSDDQQKTVDTFMRSPSMAAVARRWKQRYDFEKDRQSFYLANKDPRRYSSDNRSFARFIAGEVDIAFSKQRLEVAFNNYSARRAELLDPEVAANAENLENELKSMNAEVELAGRELMDAYVKYITSSVDSNEPFGLVCAMSAFNSAIKGQDPTIAGVVSQFLPYFREELLKWFNEKPEKADISDQYSVLDALVDVPEETKGDVLANKIRARARQEVRHFYSSPKMK